MKKNEFDAYEQIIKNTIDSAEPGSEEFNDAVKALKSLNEIRQADAKLELEEKRYFNDNVNRALDRTSEAEARKYEARLKLLGTVGVGGLGFLAAKAVEDAKEKGIILKSNEVFQWLTSLLRKS